MGKGRKPIPMQVKRWLGTVDPRATPRIGEPAGDDMICPDWLSEHSKDMWHRVMTGWAGQGVIKGIDLAVLEGFCAAYGRWRDAEAELREVGSTVKTQMGVAKHPLITVVNEAMRQMHTYGAELGFSPASRAKLSRGEPEQGDPLVSYLDKHAG